MIFKNLCEWLLFTPNYWEKRYKNSLDNDADDFIEYIVENARRMKQLIEDLLEYSRVTSQAKEFKNVDLEKIFEVLLSNLSLAITENNLM